jgi:hypothetical protein
MGIKPVVYRFDFASGQSHVQSSEKIFVPLRTSPIEAAITKYPGNWGGQGTTRQRPLNTSEWNPPARSPWSLNRMGDHWLPATQPSKAGDVAGPTTWARAAASSKDRTTDGDVPGLTSLPPSTVLMSAQWSRCNSPPLPSSAIPSQLREQQERRYLAERAQRSWDEAPVPYAQGVQPLRRLVIDTCLV